MQALAGAIGVRRVVLDGELVVLDDVGRPRFELIQRHAIDKREAAFYAFDVLSIDDHDTISLPYEDRRRLLSGVLETGSNWAVPAHRIGDGQALLDLTEAQDLEGVMAKRLGTSYRPGARSKDWRKVKHRRRAEVVIGGYTPGRACARGASAPCSSGAGSTASWRSPVASGPGSRSGASTSWASASPSWRSPSARSNRSRRRPTAAARRGCEPVLRAQVELTEFTNEGYVRQASFIDLL